MAGTIAALGGMTQTGHRLDALLRPASIAFVGASVRPNTPGNTMVRAAAMDGYRGRVYAINPKYDQVEGVSCFPDLAGLPETVDHVVLGVANDYLESNLLAAARHGARAVTIFASCDLTGAANDPLAARLTDIARDAGIVICGGNGMGFCNPQIGLRVSGFAANLAMRPGGVALVTQSGSAFSALAYNDQRLKFQLCVSSGRELTTTTADYVDWALDQPDTTVIGLFLETARRPDDFARCLEKADRLGIPVVALKVGRTELSAGFAASHSGAIAGDNAAYEALFDRWGVFSVDTLDQLAANLTLFSAGRPAAKGGLASLHDSGGEREMVADLAAKAGVPFAAISEHTREGLRLHLDSGLQPANPLDVWGSGLDFEIHVEACMDAMLADPDTAICVLFQDIRDGSYIAEGFTRAVIRSSAKTGKPVAVVSNYATVNHRALALATTEAGVPVIDGTEEGLHAISNLLAFRDRRAATHIFAPAVTRDVRERWRRRLGEARPFGESEALALLADYGIATPRVIAAATQDDVLAAAREIGFPVALKTAVPGIQHKSDVGGVRLRLGDAAALMDAYADMALRLGPEVLVAEMAPKGVEIAFGLIRDPQFGPYLVVASGGVWIEVLRDRAVALPPLSLERAQALIGRLKTSPLLDGGRGQPPADRRALATVLARFSMLAADLGDLIDEMDVNPLMISDRGCMAVDALLLGRHAGRQHDELH
ncbi:MULTISPECIES: acetate--CoA ligase family protein [unclassified Mesorhizobium]|uniref:acetate--CoA ligase family protein n=1 Tax=unclassified Mesorhizobium TaxID=325217 RepID=UPI001CC8F474|nr:MULTISPECIES: acetate--CoA ligase family protein [unclassified Mesorhizobium]MBZ9737909.1 acetate--CoA ligase family protein [Mesorhizobium sp. CO1-1-4]MBZ9801904.1 acetate--CoA ligase family protein [Mesorhizobium sp. ES1-6]